MKTKCKTMIALSALYVVMAVFSAPAVALEGGFDGGVATVVVSPSTEADTYGGASQTVMIVGSYMFQGREPSDTMQVIGGIDRFLNVANGVAHAHPVLPNGALIEAIELRACDTSGGADVSLALAVCVNPGAACALVASVSTGGPTTPGCGNFPVHLPTPLRVDNQNPLALEIRTGTTGATTFSAAKLYYRLQVSPAPGVATFSDVPTSHPFFQFVEALASSGITAGCGAGSFCPDAPLTRGQMAVFLAAALGLHFPN